MQACNEAQKAAITHEKGPVLCLAGPGSGKTFVLTRHIRYLIEEKQVDPYHILVFTFSKASAVEMQKRFFSLMGQEYYPVRFGTFHALFFQILSQYEHYRTSDIVTAAQKKKYLKTILLQMKYQGKPDIDSMENILSHISYIKNHNDMALCQQAEIRIPQFQEIYLRYEALLRQERKLDFDDMMLLCDRLLQERPQILTEYQKDVEHVLIDEYQDINQIQYQLIKKIIAPTQNLFAVGDDDQSIYGFRGCDPKIMLEFKEQFPHGKVITFPINYRCPQAIVEASGCVISKNTERFAKDIRACKKIENALNIHNFETKGEEYSTLLKKLKEMPESEWNNCACLFRTNMDASYLAELLTKEQIPYQMRERPYDPYAHFIAQDFLHYLHLKEGDMRVEEFVPIMNRPLRYLSRDAIEMTQGNQAALYPQTDACVSRVCFEKLKEFYREKEYLLCNIRKLEYDLKRMQSMDIYAAINYIRKGIGYDDFLQKHAVLQNVPAEEYLNMADELQQRMGSFVSLEQLKQHIDTFREGVNRGKTQAIDNRQATHKDEGIHILTYHASKGLEFDVVFLLDCNEGSIPYRKSVTQKQLEEERRLFYVAMTRAKEQLFIWYLDGDKEKRHLVSRFVRDAKRGCV